MRGLLEYLYDSRAEILLRSREHLELTAMAVLLAVLLGVPLGMLVSRFRCLRRPIVGIANVIQAVPSLALLGFLIPLLGIGSLPGTTMVVVYSLLPIIKNTSTGLDNIDPDLLEAARGMGLTRMQILLKVQTPLALPVIMTGIRIASVTAVGMVTLAAFIGAGGLGLLVYSGMQMVNVNQILAGAIPACAMALLMDFVMAVVERAATPPGLRPDVASLDAARLKSIRAWRRAVIAGTAVVFAAVIATGLTIRLGAWDEERKIAIGSKNFTEQWIVCHMVADLIEANTDIKVERRPNLGGTHIVFTALVNREIDLYIEYTGTIYGTVLNRGETRSAEEVYRIVKDSMRADHGLELLEPLGFNNTYAVMVSGETAREHGLKTISDLAKISSRLVAGTGMEFLNRTDGLKGMMRTYGMSFRETLSMQGETTKYIALLDGRTHVADAAATDGLLLKYDVVLLEDDKHFFPPYYAVPFATREVLDKYPEIRRILGLLAGKISDAEMREMNYKIVVLGQQPRDIAREFLRAKGLLPDKAATGETAPAVNHS